MNVNFLDLFENDFLAIFPEIFLLNAIFILLFFGLFYSDLIVNTESISKTNLTFDETKSPQKSILVAWREKLWLREALPCNLQALQAATPPQPR